MTTIRPIAVLTERQQMVREGVAIVATLLAVFAFYMVYQVAQPVVDAHGNERIMRAACKLPSTEGAMTVYIKQADKITCWEWK